MAEPKLRTERDAAGYLGLSYWTLRRLRTERRIDYVPVGRRIYYTQDDLESFIQVRRRSREC